MSEEKLPLKNNLPLLTKGKYEKLFNRLHGVTDEQTKIDCSDRLLPINSKIDNKNEE